jgi:hypothetical protein
VNFLKGYFLKEFYQYILIVQQGFILILHNVYTFIIVTTSIIFIPPLVLVSPPPFIFFNNSRYITQSNSYLILFVLMKLFDLVIRTIPTQLQIHIFKMHKFHFNTNMLFLVFYLMWGHFCLFLNLTTCFTSIRWVIGYQLIVFENLFHFTCCLLMTQF